MSEPRLLVVQASSRPNAATPVVARWALAELESRGVDVSLVDCAGLGLPFLDAPKQPSSLRRQYDHESVRAWSAKVDAADGILIVTPEYNHGYPGVLKNALDWLYWEWRDKPVALVGVSASLAGGARVIQALRLVLAGAFGMNVLFLTVQVPEVGASFGEDGTPTRDILNQTLKRAHDALVPAAATFRASRTA